MTLTQKTPTAIKVGTTDVSKVYLGTTLIRQKIVDWNIDFLIVGGGGAGGSNYYDGNAYNSVTGGGGAGGFVECCNVTLPKGSYSVVVGCRGLGCPINAANGGNGGNSCFNGVVAYGGGGGGGNCKVGSNGASGGGGGCTKSGGSGCQGYGGGAAGAKGGGGGGAGGAGTSGDNEGIGGIGKYSEISGEGCWYAGGGGGVAGKCAECYNCGTAYCGGGGHGSYNGTGGECACRCADTEGQPGVVIIRYPTNCGTATGGTMVTCNGYNIHTFTSDGTFSY